MFSDDAPGHLVSFRPLAFGAWEIEENFGPESRPGVDASGWLWVLARWKRRHRHLVLVEISVTAMKSEREPLPSDTRAAIETEGRSEVEKILDEEEPPQVIQCGTWGCRWLSAEEVDLAPLF
jgi:hypothetical protein